MTTTLRIKDDHGVVATQCGDSGWLDVTGCRHSDRDQRLLDAFAAGLTSDLRSFHSVNPRLVALVSTP